MGDGTTLGSVRGLGSAKEGEHHWTMQRYTALGNLFLGSWLAVSFALMPDWSYNSISGWMVGTIPTLCLALFIISTFWHARLGLQVLIEDYVRDAGTKWGMLALINMLALAGTVAGLLFLLKAVVAAIAKQATDSTLAQIMSMGGGF
jgi:succinate dehydrogenase / fumarate reductase membrane anchor subunit